jgi:hypothetical protein
LRRFAGVSEAGARSRNPERFLARDLYAISVSLFSDELSKSLRAMPHN